jgi:hypothetical protein
MINLPNTFENSIALARSIELDRQMIPVFDLDGVAIDATHRQILKPDGSLDLDNYRANSTPEKIALDTALPFAITMQQLTEMKRDFFICTARVMCRSSEKWLTKRGINASAIFSRDGESDIRRDFKLKHDHLTSYFSDQELMRAVLIDDNQANLKMAESIGMTAIHVPFHGH